MQQALIVDDSKTARVALHRMLDKFHISASMVESAEEALEFLEHHHPDVIFMDHMMPGMDGFAAVKAIKSNPEKASIPIVMHTTREGDIYVGQARALGAIDILAKPATDQDLKAVLERVRKNTNSTHYNNPLPEALSTESSNDIALNTDAAYITRSDMPVLPETASMLEKAPFFGTPRQWFLALIWLIPIVWLLFLYLSAERQLQFQSTQQQAYLKALEWVINQHEAYDYGEVPLSGERLILLQGVVEKLQAAGFEGVIRLEGHIGEFCLTSVPLSDGTEMLILPRPELPVASCTMIGTSVASAMEQSIAQSEEFKQFLTASGLQAMDSAIRVELLPLGASTPRYSYPADLEAVSTGDWNTVALKNNRVHFVFESQ
jgi:CheY-like chemotaxis protein